MSVTANSRVDEAPQRRQVAVAQPLHCRRIAAPESSQEFGIVQNVFSPVDAALACRVAEI
jgi:hypothetical protein